MTDDDRPKLTVSTWMQAFGIVSMILVSAFAGFYKGVSESQKDIDALRTELAVVTEKLQNSNQRQAEILIELGKLNGRIDQLQRQWTEPGPPVRRSASRASVFPNTFNGGTSQ